MFEVFRVNSFIEITNNSLIKKFAIMSKNKIFVFFPLIMSVLWSSFELSDTKLSLYNTSKENIDSIMVNVFYLFKQQAYNQNEVIIRTDTMILSVGQQWSVYFDYNKEKRDSIGRVNLATNPVFRKVEVRTDQEALQSRLEHNISVYDLIDASKGESAKIFKHRPEKKITTIDEYAETYYRLVEHPLSFDWVITNDTLTLLNYSCLKALTKFRGREYTAWFTMDIPINDGPWKLYGLPGLILKVEDSENLFSFEAFGLHRIENKFIEMKDHRGAIECVNYNQLQKVRNERHKRVAYGFVENGSMVYYNSKNPIQLINLEK